MNINTTRRVILFNWAALKKSALIGTALIVLLEISFLNGCKQNSEEPFYGIPKFTSFKIPNASTTKKGSKVTAVVSGANFKVPGVSVSYFTVSCEEKSITANSSITIVSNSELKVILTVPDTEKAYEVKITGGKQDTISGTFTVTGPSAGQIRLKDGSFVDNSSYSKIDKNNPPIAVVCGKSGAGKTLSIALHISGSGLSWAKKDTAGYNTKFNSIVCDSSDYGAGAAATATFTGDVDGSDNWNEICTKDPTGTTNAATNYPAFGWVNNYNTKYAKVLGGTTHKWYMPSLAELCEVYKNREKINESLAKISSLPDGSQYADSTLYSGLFWSSSQSSDIYFYTARCVDFSGGTVNLYSKHDDNRVCCLASF